MANRLPLVRVGGKTAQIPVGDALQLRGAINEAPAAQLVSGTNYEPSTETISWDSVPSNSAITLPTGSNGYSFMFGATIGSVRRLILRAGDYLQHNDGFVELPTKAAITATDGDVATFQRRASSGNRWVCISYVRGDGRALVSSSGPTNTDGLPEGTTNLYFTGARVLATVLNGLSLATGTAVIATDSILVAIGKLQAQNTAQDMAINGKEPTIAAGNSSQYWNGAKVFVDFAASVRSAVLTGLSLATTTPVTAADTTLVAFGKLQAQITALGGAFRVENVAATSVGQTSFAVPNGYTPGAIMVFFKGVLQAPADYTASDGANVVLAVGAESVGDTLSVGVVGAVRAQDDALLSYTVATLPAASSSTAKLRYCTNMSGGAGPVFSDGTNWKRVADNSIVTV